MWLTRRAACLCHFCRYGRIVPCLCQRRDLSADHLCRAKLRLRQVRQDPDRADQAIVIDNYDAADGQGHVITAEGVARASAAQEKARGAVLLPAFATPDPLNPGKFSFFTTFYYAYPADGNGDIWIGKVSQFGDAIVGILYKQQVQGADVAAIAASVKNWLLHNLRTYGDALSALTPPPKADARN